MSVTYYRDLAGRFLGAFAGEHRAPAVAVVVPSAPADARQVWNGSDWGAAPAPVKPRDEMLIDTLAAKGVLTAAEAGALKGEGKP
jgi:hypothetical protein